MKSGAAQRQSGHAGGAVRRVGGPPGISKRAQRRATAPHTAFPLFASTATLSKRRPATFLAPEESRDPHAQGTLLCGCAWA